MIKSIEVYLFYDKTTQERKHKDGIIYEKEQNKINCKPIIIKITVNHFNMCLNTRNKYLGQTISHKN